MKTYRPEQIESIELHVRFQQRFSTVIIVTSSINKLLVNSKMAICAILAYCHGHETLSPTPLFPDPRLRNDDNE